MRFWGFLFGIFLLSAHAANTGKSFDGITCQSITPSALIGRDMPNERVLTIEARYRSIGLKDLGAFGMEPEGDPWTLVSWEICGREYLLLEHHDIVRDALASPMPPGGPQSQIASCSVNGSSLQGTAVAFFEKNDEKSPKPVKAAWLINDKTIKFERISGKKIVCVP